MTKAIAVIVFALVVAATGLCSGLSTFQPSARKIGLMVAAFVFDSPMPSER